jgi:hypothetical protein
LQPINFENFNHFSGFLIYYQRLNSDEAANFYTGNTAPVWRKCDPAPSGQPPVMATLVEAECSFGVSPVNQFFLAAFLFCQCWFNAFVTFASHVRSWTCSSSSDAAKNFTLYGDGLPNGFGRSNRRQTTGKFLRCGKQIFLAMTVRSVSLKRNKGKIMKLKLPAIAIVTGVLIEFNSQNVNAWDYEGHHVVNELALASLPPDFGIQLTTALQDRIAFLAGEPDRWRNISDLPLKHINGPDHYIDLEDLTLYGLTPETLPIMRYDFVADIARTRAEHPERFPPIDPAKDTDHTRELSGFLPWAITEDYEKLKSDFSSLKAFQTHGGTPEEIANAQADIVYVMGVMGHFVGDGSQPLHTTKYFNGWDPSDNPKGYTTRPTFHAWIDGGYFRKIGGIKVDALIGKIQPATRIPNADDPEAFFRYVVAYLVAQNKFVEPLYELDKEGGLTGEGGKGMEGAPFLENQLIKAGQMLGNIWYTAWLDAPEDTYLERQLDQRNAAPVNQ